MTRSCSLYLVDAPVIVRSALSRPTKSFSWDLTAHAHKACRSAKQDLNLRTEPGGTSNGPQVKPQGLAVRIGLGMSPMVRPRLGVAVVGQAQAARADVAHRRAAQHAHDLRGAAAVVADGQHVRHARRERPQVPCAAAARAGSAHGAREHGPPVCNTGSVQGAPVVLLGAAGLKVVTQMVEAAALFYALDPGRE